MALTKAQASLVTVSTLGVAPGGYLAELQAFNSQKEAAAFIATTGLLNAGTNAEFALEVQKNLGVTAGGLELKAFLKALDEGTSRAEAAVDFANTQLVLNGGKIANVEKAAAYEGESKDLAVLKAALAEAEKSTTIITFEDLENANSLVTGPTGQTIHNIGKAEIDAGLGKISADYTFQLKDQIGENDTFKGQFLSPILDRQSPDKTGSQIVLELRNLREADSSTTPLKSLPTEGFAFVMDGVNLLVASEGILNALTYQELRDAVAARVKELSEGVNIPSDAGVSNNAADYAKLATFNVELGNSFNVQADGKTVTGLQVVLTDKAGSNLSPLAFKNKDGIIVDTGYTLYAEIKESAADTVTKQISTNLEADNVGYGSQGATVNLVGQSASNKGVEEIKLIATGGVWFTSLESEAGNYGSVKNHLQSIELQAGSDDYFRVGTQKNSNTHVVNLTEQNFNAGGLFDVREVNAVNAGSTAINAFVSKAVIARDYNLKDTGLWAADNIDTSFNLSSGRDVLNLAIDQNVMEAVDTQVNINTGAGDDVIHFQVTNGLTATGHVNLAGNGGWLTNQQLLNNVKIDAGDGNDQIVLSGAGNVTVNAGTGNDEVRADNTGGKAVFVFNNQTTEINQLLTNQDIVSNSNAANSTGANGIQQTLPLFKATVKVSFLGFESDAVVIDSTNFATNTKQINQAIKKAIADSPQLSKLLAAHDNEGNALGIESLVDGALNLSDLKISITAPAAYDANETEGAKALRVANGQEMLSKDDLLNAAKAVNPAATVADEKYSNLTDSVNYLNTNNVYASEFATVGGVIVNGSDSTAQSDNTINLGQGTDILMMGTGANSNDTLVLTGYNNGTNTIVHYSSLAGAGQDYLNLNAYVAGNSNVVLDTIANATGTLANNTVSKVAVNLSKDAFANFTNADLVKYLNYETPASGDPANIDAGLKAALSGLAATVDLNLKASTNYVLMLENSNNPGEYKAFHVTAATGDNKGKFAGAETIATLDFGVPTTGAGAVVPPVGAKVIPVNVTPAADDSYKGTFDGTAEADVFTVNATEASLENLVAEISITNFGANDSLSFKGVYAAGMNNTILGVGQPVDISMDGANLQVILMDAPTLGDIDTWIVTFEDVDASIAAVVNGAADTQAALAGLNDAWNAEWLVLA